MDEIVFVQNVKKACEAKGVKLAVALRDSGLDKSFINNIEARGSTPSVEKVQMLAAYLGVTTSELLGEEKEPAPVSEGGTDPLDARLNELLPLATDETKRAMIVLLEQTQKQ